MVKRLETLRIYSDFFEKYYNAVLHKKVDSVRTDVAKKKWKEIKDTGLKELQANTRHHCILL